MHPTPRQKLALLGSLALVLPAVAGACATPMISLSDVVVAGGGHTAIDAFTEHSSALGDVDQLAGVDVTFLADGRELGTARTDTVGLARWSCCLPPGARTVQARATVDGKQVAGEARVYEWDPMRTIIVCDIDETVSLTDYASLLSDDSADSGSKPLPGAARTMKELAGRFNLIYITGRPRFLLNKSRRWLERNGFPPAPVVTALTLAEAIGVQKYKGGQIADLKCLSSNLLIGIGNARTDSEAYASQGLLTLIIEDDDSNMFRSHAIVVRNWDMLHRFFDANREVLEDPARLAAVIAEQGMLLQPVIGYEER